MKKIGFLLALVLVFAGLVVASHAVENQGLKDMVLDGGKTGDVPFPHHLHQNTLEDCQLCHSLFPQEQGGIDRMVKEGKLKNKEVMKNCQKCHRKLEKSGQPSGPTSCKGCHSK